MISNGMYAYPRREDFKRITKHFYLFKLNYYILL